MENNTQEHGHEEVYEQVPVDYWERSYKTNPIQWLYHFWRFIFIRKMVDALPRRAKILDIGCGSGFAIEQCVKNRPDIQVCGIDVTESLINYASKTRPKFKFFLAKGETLPFADNEFDSVLYLDVIEHLLDPAKSLMEARRCLKKDGKLIILVVLENHPVFRIIWSLWLKLKGKVWHGAHLFIFTKKTLVDLVEKSGFEVTKINNLFLGMSVLLEAKKK